VQVLCSGDTYEACVGGEDGRQMERVEVVDAGCYRLKGLNGIVRIYHCWCAPPVLHIGRQLGMHR
jgi:class 3 adenylate cyclase